MDIDECAINGNPCHNGGTCQDLINNYACVCHGGYNGTNCEYDIGECGHKSDTETNPCQNGGMCFEKSDQGLYHLQETSKPLPAAVRQYFKKPFSYEEAEGYICKCSDGYEGK